MKQIRTRLLATALMLLATPQMALADQKLPKPQPVQTAAAAPEQLHPALWKIADADTTIYLFGTVHLLPKDKEWINGKLATAIQQSSELVTEIPEVPAEQTQAAIMQHGVLPQGQTLRAMMNDAERAKYEAALQKLGIPAEAFDQLKPWMAAVTLATIPLMAKGYDVSNGAEAALDARNKALGRPRSGLETLDFQIGLFDTFAPDVQKRYLFEVIDAIPHIDEDIGAMVDAWGKGDPDKLAELMNAEEDDPAMIETLLVGRNRNWAKWLQQRMDKPGTVFVAVGAGHLGGKGSVQEQLAAAGITVTRVQ